MAEEHGWVFIHHFNSLGTTPGWPDVVLIHPPDMLFVELKVPPNGATKAQLDMLAKIRQCGGRTYLWTPDDWPEIKRVLAAKPVVVSKLRGRGR